MFFSLGFLAYPSPAWMKVREAHALICIYMCVWVWVCGSIPFLFDSNPSFNPAVFFSPRINMAEPMIPKTDNAMLLLVSFIFLVLFHKPSSCAQYNLTFDVAEQGHLIPSNLFGIFFEEINHAGAGGLWAELVANRGFEAGGQSTPSNIVPWTAIGDEKLVRLETESSSIFKQNPIALRVEILHDTGPENGVGVYNPGYWGMNIVLGSDYKVVFWARSTEEMNVCISFTSSDGKRILAQRHIRLGSLNSSNVWTRQEIHLIPADTDHYGRLSVTSTQKGVFWIDQVSVMPSDTYKGHGFRKDLAAMLENLKPKFIRFPGGCFVEGQWLRNSFHWRQTIGPWQERPGHFGDVWDYWTDDGLGYFEFLQLAEDMNAEPIWVFNNGISHTDEVESTMIEPFVEDVLNGIEFARGASNSSWGSIRSSMGHPEPFSLNYVAVGNEDCGKQYYLGNYMKFYEGIKLMYPDISIISNCDGSSKPLDHPADMYDFHVYASANQLFAMAHQFVNTSRIGPKVFVSEYAVTGQDAGKGSLYAALAEANFLIGIEKNSDVVEMVSYAPLFVNNDDRRWNPDAIVFDSWQSYGTPSYWIQTFFSHSNGATLLPCVITGDGSVPNAVTASVIRRYDIDDDGGGGGGLEYVDIKVLNFGESKNTIHLVMNGLLPGDINQPAAITRLISQNVMDENNFNQKQKIFPKVETLHNAGINMDVDIPAFSLNMITVQLITPLYSPM